MSGRNVPYHERDVNNPPDYLDEKQKKNWKKTAIKAKHNVELGEQYPPLTLPRSSYEIVHLHRRTTYDDLQRVIKHVEVCYEFTLDTESDRTSKKLSLIQIQTIPSHLPLVVILVAVQHLPDIHTPLHQQMKKLFDMIFNKKNVLYSWGQLSTELKPIQQYKLVDWPIKSYIINMQDEFPIWYRWALSHCEICCLKKGNSDSKYKIQVECTCHPKDPYRRNEKWAIQLALAYAVELFIDKSSTTGEWSNLLDPKYTRLTTFDSNKLMNYAIKDCFAVTCLIRPVLNKWSFQKVTDTRIIDFFQALASAELELLIHSCEQRQQFIVKDKFYNDITFISDEENDDEIYLHQLVEPVNDDDILLTQIKNEQAVAVIPQDDELLINLPLLDVNVEHLNDDVMIESRIDEPTIDVIMNDDDQMNGVNNHSVIVDGMNNPIEHHQQRVKKKRSLEAKQKKNRKRNNQLRLMRYRYYLTRSYYYRFKSRNVKKVLQYYDVQYRHIKFKDERVVIGVKTDTARHVYEETLPHNCFNRRNYWRFKK